MERLESIGLSNIEITDRFWRRYTDLVPSVTIPYQWDILNDRVAEAEPSNRFENYKADDVVSLIGRVQQPDGYTGAEPSNCLRNYRIAAGEEAGEHRGTVFLDTDLSKWLEAVAFSLQTNPDQELENKADDVISLIGRVQQPDGYINTYYTIAEPEKRWSNLTEGHELYSAGHLIEASVAYFQATGKDKLLNISIRFADLLCRTFGRGENQIHGYPGHQEIELALIKLYRVTGVRKYLELAMYFINVRGGEPNYFLEEMKRDDFVHFFDEFKNYDPAYSQSHMPPRKQRTAEGHAVRATYMYSAMAELAHEYGDVELMGACEAIWKNIVSKRMYLTGSIGSSAMLERFTTDYDLPNDVNYSETCASIGLAMFGVRMSRIKRDASYMDVVERALYNTVLAGIALKGDRYFYVNPLEVWPASCMEHTSKAHVKPVRQKWFNVACCPTNISRTLASLGNYIYSVDGNSIFLNLFISNRTELEMKGSELTAQLQSSFLTDGKSRLTITAGKPVEFDLNVRIPGYVKGWKIRIDGSEFTPGETRNGYATISRNWSGTTVVEVLFDIRAEFVAAHPEVRADAGRVAIVKGPLVYCLEEVDNGGNLASIVVDPSTELSEQFDGEFFDGVVLVKFNGSRITGEGWNGELYKPAAFRTAPVELTAIPYCYWANRGVNEMIVWMHAKI